MPGSTRLFMREINGIAKVTLDAPASSDADGDALTCRWTWQIGLDIYDADGTNPTIELPIGVHIFQLVVNDGLRILHRMMSI